MSQINRPCVHGPVTIDIGLIEAIEGALIIDEAPGPDVIAALVARADAEYDARRDPAANKQLVEDAREALDCCWLSLDEVHAVQRLRGWHRARYGGVTVDAYWLAAVRNVLDGLTLSLGEECEGELRQLDWPGAYEIHAAVIKSMIRTGRCSECQWCTVLRLRDEVDAILDAAGYYGGVYYEAYCRADREAA
jgi:hypothetical protein